MMELNVCEGDYGLPSLDSNCLRLLLLARVAKVPLNVSVKLPYPTLHRLDGSRLADDCTAATQHLLQVGCSPDVGLRADQLSDCYAFSTLLEHVMRPVLSYVWWINDYNYDNFTARWLRSSAAFPASFAAAKRMRQTARLYFEMRFPNVSGDAVKPSLLRDFDELCLTFGRKLAASRFLYGQAISSLDILLYSYLAPLLKIPFPENDWRDVVESQPALVRFVAHVTHVYFPEVAYTEKYIKTAMFDDELDGGLRSLVLFAFLVTTAMMSLSLTKHLYASASSN